MKREDKKKGKKESRKGWEFALDKFSKSRQGIGEEPSGRDNADLAWPLLRLTGALVYWRRK